MKKILFYLTLIWSITLTTSCENELEKGSLDKQQLIPKITSFTPISGHVDSEITIVGENLQGVYRAYIDDKEVDILSEESATDMIIKASLVAGQTGVIKLKSSGGVAVSDTVFYCKYPEPSVTSEILTEFGGDDQFAFTGITLDVVRSVYFDDKEAKIISQTATELVVTIPNITKSSINIIFNCFNGEGEDLLPIIIKEGVTIIYLDKTPTITTTVPASFGGGEETTFTGTYLDVVLSAYFDDTEATITSQSPTELVLSIPNVAKSNIDIIFNYPDSEGNPVPLVVKSGVTIVFNDTAPTITNVTSGASVGEVVTVTGTNLAQITKVTLGGIDMVIGTKDATSLTFTIGSDPLFTPGSNTKTILLYYSETESVSTSLTFEVPATSNYKYWQGELNANSGTFDNHYFNFETGEMHPGADFDAKVDPLTISFGGKVCVGKNKLDGTVTDDQYYGVKPYMFTYLLGSTGFIMYGPANNSNRLQGMPPKTTPANSYGTPIILFRTLTSNVAAEATIINKITNKTFNSDDFTSALLDDITLTGSGTDGYSNIPNGEFNAYRATSASNIARPWAPSLSAKDSPQNSEPKTVILVLYMKPNKETLSVVKGNVYKFGFIYVKTLTLNGTHNSKVTFDVYWQQTPMN